MVFSETEINTVTKTARCNGAVGSKAVVPKEVRSYADCTFGKLTYILDFGSGKKAMHTKALREEGYKHAYAYDFEIDPSVADFEIKNPRNITWDIIFASNVLNVQTSEGMMDRTLEMLRRMSSPETTLIVNFPKTPRKNSVTVEKLQEKFKRFFEYDFHVDMKNHVFVLFNPITKERG